MQAALAEAEDGRIAAEVGRQAWGGGGHVIGRAAPASYTYQPLLPMGLPALPERPVGILPWAWACLHCQGLQEGNLEP